jgi:ornithine carbamoyltransferase
VRHFLDISDFSTSQLRAMLDAGRAIKARRRTAEAKADKPLDGKVVAMIFDQPSLRTRASFEVGITELGGSPMMVTGKEIELGERETVADTARVFSRYVDAIMIRILDHAHLLELAEYATVPVINGLTDLLHPCQLLADVMTVEERLGSIKGKKIAWVGDGNNMANSWIIAAEKMHFTLHLACPKTLPPHADILREAKANGAHITLGTNPQEAVAGADVVVTDTWVSMGDDDTLTRKQAFKGFQVNAALMAQAKPEALFLHCLPAHRGEEVTDEVLDGAQSAVWDEAENRLHVQKAVLLWCLREM